MAELHVEIVAVERELWSGDATFVFTRTTAGEIGILPRHIPLVAQLVDDAMVRVEREGEDDLLLLPVAPVPVCRSALIGRANLRDDGDPAPPARPAASSSTLRSWPPPGVV